MTYAFLVFALLWIVQLSLGYVQLRRFNGRIFALRKQGRCAVGLHGDRWRGRTYAILVINEAEIVQQVEVFGGWTVFAKPRAINSLNGQPLAASLAAEQPAAGFSKQQWAALKHAASFFKSETPSTSALAAA
jgi:glucitol operon activator protein